MHLVGSVAEVTEGHRDLMELELSLGIGCHVGAIGISLRLEHLGQAGSFVGKEHVVVGQHQTSALFGLGGGGVGSRGEAKGRLIDQGGHLDSRQLAGVAAKNDFARLDLAAETRLAQVTQAVTSEQTAATEHLADEVLAGPTVELGVSGQ